MGGSKSSNKAKSSSKANTKTKKLTKLQKRINATFGTDAVNRLKQQHASFKAHQKAGTLSTHQKKYKTGAYSLSGAQRAQNAARERIAGLNVKPSSKSWVGNLTNSITTSWKNLDNSLTSWQGINNRDADGNIKVPGFMGDSSTNWGMVANKTKDLGNWANQFRINTLKDINSPGSIFGAGYRNVYKGFLGGDEGFGSGFSDMKPSLATAPIAFGKGMVDLVPTVGQFLPGKIGEASHNYLKRSQFKDRSLATTHFAGGLYAPVGNVLKGTNLAIKGLKSYATVNKASKIARASKIGPIADKGLKGWFYKGMNQRVPNENLAKLFGKGSLYADDVSQVGKFPRDIPFKGIGPSQRVFDAGLKGTSFPKNLTQAKQFLQGKGGGTWSFSRGVPTGPTAFGRQAVLRPLRTVAAAGDVTKAVVKGIPQGIRNTALIGGGTLGLTAKAFKALPPEIQAKTGSDILGHPWGLSATDSLTKLGPDHWGNQWASDVLGRMVEPGIEYANEQRGLKGAIARTQAGKITKGLNTGNLNKASRAIRGTFELAERYGGDIPNFGDLTYGNLQKGWNLLTNRGVTSPVTASRNAMSIASGRGRGGKMRVQDVDLNKIGAQTSNIYGAAQDEQDLAAFWQRQDQINEAAEQRLKDIQSDRSTYANLQPQLAGYADQYTQELDRIKPFGQQYIDELARLQPYDKQFTSSIADLIKGRDELRGYRGQWTHPDDVKFLNEQLPQYDTAISDLESQYKGYKTSIADITKGQKDYQSYLSELQTGQKDLSAYRTDITKRQGELEDYSKAFTSAKLASDQAAKSYTIRAQQGISGNLRTGVSGIRTGGGFRTIGSGRDRSPKRRFNRDFRIGSFGDTSMSPINV